MCFSACFWEVRELSGNRLGSVVFLKKWSLIQKTIRKRLNTWIQDFPAGSQANTWCCVVSNVFWKCSRILTVFSQMLEGTCSLERKRTHTHTLLSVLTSRRHYPAIWSLPLQTERLMNFWMNSFTLSNCLQPGSLSVGCPWRSMAA